MALSLFHTLAAQENEKIRLQVRVISSADGMEIADASVKMMYALTENQVPLKTEKRNRFYEVVKGSDLKISAEASRFYAEQKHFETDHLYDEDILEIQLTPLPAEVAATSAPFFVVVRDLVSGERLEGRVEVTRPSGMVDYVNSGNTYQPAEVGEYNFIFRRDGFGSYTQKLYTRPSSEIALLPVNFEIRSVTFTEHEYTLVDAHTQKTVMKSQLFILDDAKKAVETLYNSSKGTYMTYRINPEKTYTAEVRAEGYEPLTIPLTNSGRNVTLELTPAGLQKTAFVALDEYTKKPVETRHFSITSPAGTEMPAQNEGTAFTGLLHPQYPYRVRVEAEGYPLFEREITAGKTPVEILIRKTSYPLALVVSNALDDAQKAGAAATVTQANGTALPVTFDVNSQSFLLESDPEQVVQIAITVPGFRPYVASNNRSQLAQFQLNVQLEPITEEVAVAATTPPSAVPPSAAPTLREPAADEPMEAKKGRRYALNGVNFEQSQTAMLPGSEEKLREVLQFMQDHPQVRIEVIGHTDKTGDERQNQRLSEFRARAVANWLFNQGINSARMTTSGKGSAEPVAPNDTEEGKALNRRIEVMVIED